MQVVIPMAGFGERFRQAGYEVPKPLIEVDGRPMVHHVIDLFPGAERVVLICNADHLAEPAWRMREILLEGCPSAEIVSVASHRRGPVHTLVEVLHHLDPDAPTAIAMCDLNFPWDFEHFRRWVEASRSEGCVVTYRGFHPHLLRSVHYAFVRHDDQWATAIQEKAAFTDDPIATGEHCSNGVYWFASGALAARYLETVHGDEDQAIDGEHYVSQAFQPMIDDGLDVSIYEVQHYLQWGNPRDLEEYRFHARGFALRAAAVPDPTVSPGTLLVPMAGFGQRFADRGVDTPKPLIEVCGRPMAVSAALDLPRMAHQVFVLRRDLPGVDAIVDALRDVFPTCRPVILDGPTDGQARTALLGVEQGAVDPEAPLVIGTCDNGVLFDAAAHRGALAEADVLVWGFRGHPAARLHPNAYGWIDAAADGRVRGISVKVPLDDPETDPIVIGTFAFRRASDFARACARMFARDARVRGEFYIDTALQDCLALGLDVRLFEVDHYDGWGTPDELDTFTYWQSHFHKWPDHPYRLERDARIPLEAVPRLDARYAARVPPPLAPRRRGE